MWQMRNASVASVSVQQSHRESSCRPAQPIVCYSQMLVFFSVFAFFM
jgi:hypothetical protein